MRRTSLMVGGAIAILGAMIAIIISPPAITLYQHDGFFWWGVVPGFIFTGGLYAIIIGSQLEQ